MGRLILLILLLALSAAQADEDDEVDYQQATHLVEQGVILPLEQVLALAWVLYPGDLLEVELELEDGRYFYEIELLGRNGRVVEILFDAASGKLIKEKEEDD